MHNTAPLVIPAHAGIFFSRRAALRSARVTLAGLILAVALTGTALAAPNVIASIDLSKPFGTRSPWSFQATRGPDTKDVYGSPMPGIITLCLSGKDENICDPDLLTEFAGDNSSDDPESKTLFNEPHSLDDPQILYPEGKGHPPLLWVRTWSGSSVDGNTGILTQVLAYNRINNRFYEIYNHLTSSNNDQETRFINAGPLRGDIISVDPTENAPFAFWIVVNALTPSYKYHQVLRYRSTTRYGDNNMLSVIDSDMPNIQRRLGLWHPGLPLPASGCSKPQLTHDELWCR